MFGDQSRGDDVSLLPCRMIKGDRELQGRVLPENMRSESDPREMPARVR